MRFYYFEMAGSAVFAITGVLAVTRRRSCSDASRSSMLQRMAPDFPYAGVTGFTIIFGMRAIAIHRHLEMPARLTHRDRSPE